MLNEISLPNYLDELEAYLAQAEQQIENPTPNTEKKIIWANKLTRQKTGIAVVYLHGFSATRQEVAPLCDEIASALGANLFYTRLSGHGLDSDAMAKITVDALLSDALEAFEIGKRLGEKIILIGNSTGATLACWLALRDADNAVHSLVLLSPNFGLKDKRSELLLLPFGKELLKILQGPVYRFEPANAAQAKYWTIEFPSVALLPMMALVKLVRTSALKKIRSPVLALYCKRDEVVNVSAIKKYFSRIGSLTKEITEVKNASSAKHHVLAGDILSPATTHDVKNIILQFVKRATPQ